MKLKKILALTLVLGMMAGSLSTNVNAKVEKKSGEEEKANYIVQMNSGKVLKSTLEKYDEAETVSSFVQNELEEENIASLSLTENEAEQLKKNDNIVTIENDKKVKASKANRVKKINYKDIDLEWNKKLIKSDFYKRKKTKRKVKIAVIDSGVDWGNDIDLEETITLVPGEEEMNPLFMDGTGHGNSVAGLIAAKDNDQGITGINPNAKIYSIRVLDDNNEAPLSRVIDGIYYAISKKVDIINMSFGLDSYSEALKKAVDDAEKAGILVIAAAGNTGDNVQYPAAYENVVSVGSVDSEAELADTSARGEKIDIVAPGELVCSTGEFGDLLIESGTSLAAPQVAAVASKIMEENPKASSEEVKNAIVNGANYNSDEYGILDEQYALDNYDDLKRLDKENTLKNNDSSIEMIEDTGCVKGSWSVSIHEALVGSGHSNVKKGARYPDTSTNMKGLGDNPWWHGGYKTNYIAAYIFATRVAEKLGKGSAASSASVVSGLSASDKSSMLSDIGKISWSSVGMDTEGKKRAFMWGIAIHTVADVFAHSAFVYSKSAGKWCHLAHGEKNEKTGVIPNNYADNTGKYDGRFYSAEAVVGKIVAKYDSANGAGTYKQFSGISSGKKEYRLGDLLENIKSTTSDSVSSPYDDYSISRTSSRGILEYWWEG